MCSTYKVDNLAKLLLLLTVLPNDIQALNSNSNILQEFWTDDELHIARAIAWLVEKAYLPETTMVDVLMAYSNPLEKYKQEQFMNEILKRLPLLTVRLDFTHSMHLCEPRYYLLIIADKPESFRNALQSFDQSPYDFAGYVILFFTNLVHHWELNSVFRICLEYNVVNIVLILPHKDTVFKLYTYFPFTEDSCYNSRKVEFCHLYRNRLTDHKGRECEVFPNKITNFHGCEFYANIWEIPPEIIYKKRIFGELRLEGIEGEILNTLEKAFNFRLVIRHLEVYKKKHGLDLTRSLHHANFSIGRNYYPSHLQSTITPSATYYTSRLVLVTHVGQALNLVQIMWLILQRGLWLVLLVLVLLPMLALLVLLRLRRSVLEYIIGDNNHAPYYNVIVTIFGGAANFKARRNVAAYIFISWLWVTLVIRQGYQSMLYKYMRSEPRVQMPQTIDALLKSGHRIGVSPLLYDIIKQMPQFDEHFFILINKSEQRAMKSVEDHEGTIEALITPMESFMFYKQTMDYQESLYALQEPIFGLRICIHYRKRSYLKPSFDYVITSLTSFGLINYWESIYTSKLLHLSNETDSSMVTAERNSLMQFEDFKGLVIMYFLLISVAFIALVREILTARKQKRKLNKNFKNQYKGLKTVKNNA